MTSDPFFAYVQELLRRRAGIELDASKSYLLSSRLAPVAREAGYRSPEELLSRLTCPIGLPGIRSKKPAAIAASTVAQMLQLDEQLRRDDQDAFARMRQPEPAWKTRAEWGGGWANSSRASGV